MALSTYDWVYGISQIAAVLLSVIAGLIALSIMRSAKKQELLRAWKFLAPAIVLFAIEELLGAFRTFDLYGLPQLAWIPTGMVTFLTTAATHIVPFFIILFLIASLVIQINIKKGWMD